MVGCKGNHDGEGALAPGRVAAADVWLGQLEAMDGVHSNEMPWRERVLLDGSRPWCQAALSSCRPRDVSGNGSASTGGSTQRFLEIHQEPQKSPNSSCN
ncbi:hypothetical protein EJ110_NYTH42032 [Nymphaea thermarum]|nr:hypothetical protein EJ110_NYTH42032 [Nymphaea thermarum]